MGTTTTDSPRAGSLFDELRRRKVYQTTAAYGAAVFIVWQIADITVPALGLPPSLLRFVVITALLGFPVAIGLSWIFEVVPQARLDAPGPPARWVPGRSLALAGGLVLLLGVAGWIVLPRQPLSLGESDSVLIADLTNETADTIFDGTLDQAFRLSLEASSRIAVVSAPRIRQGLAEMRRSADARLDEPTARELAVRLGAGGVLVPSIRSNGSRYVIEARLVDPVTERTAGRVSETAKNREAVLDAVDRLARELRREIGETLASMAKSQIRLRQATTTSLDALKAWSDGVRQSNAGHDEEAGILFHRAVELDSAFAVAQASLGQWYYWNRNDPVHGDSAFDRALSHLDGVSERERLSIRGTVSQWRGNLEDAVNWFVMLTTLAPLDPVGWGRLGYAYLRLGRDEQAIDSYWRVTRIDSLDANAWVNLGTLYYGMGRLEESVPLYERAFRLQPNMRTRPVLNEEYGHDLTLLGRFAQAESLYALMLERSPTSRARGLRSMAMLKAFMGRHAEAAELLRQAVVLHQAGGSPISEVRDRAFLAVELIELGRTRDALREVDAAISLGVRNRVPPILVVTAGVLAVRMGRRDEAGVLLDSATARTGISVADRAALEYLRGEIALADGDAARAVERLDAAVTLQEASQGTTVRVLSSLARAHLARGDQDKATALLEEVVAATGSRTSREDQYEWIIAHYRLANLYMEHGREADARAAYQKFLSLWGAAIPETSTVTDARRRLAALTPG